MYNRQKDIKPNRQTVKNYYNQINKQTDGQRDKKKISMY